MSKIPGLDKNGLDEDGNMILDETTSHLKVSKSKNKLPFRTDGVKNVNHGQKKNREHVVTYWNDQLTSTLSSGQASSFQHPGGDELTTDSNLSTQPLKETNEKEREDLATDMLEDKPEGNGTTQQVDSINLTSVSSLTGKWKFKCASLSFFFSTF